MAKANGSRLLNPITATTTIPMKTKAKLQPYLSYNDRKIEALDDNASQFAVGTNLFLSGHHSKLSLEYSTFKYAASDAVNVVTLQAMIYL